MDSHFRKTSISWAAFLALLAAVIMWPTAARADNYVDYTVDGTFSSGGTMSGSFTVDTTTDVITTADITADGANFTCPDGLGNGCILYSDLYGSLDGFLAGPDPGEFLVLAWTGSDQSQFALSNGSYCEGCVVGISQDSLASGTATDGPMSTPEPGTWVLLIAGLAAMACLILRRRGLATVGAA